MKSDDGDTRSSPAIFRKIEIFREWSEARHNCRHYIQKKNCAGVPSYAYLSQNTYGHKQFPWKNFKSFLLLKSPILINFFVEIEILLYSGDIYLSNHERQRSVVGEATLSFTQFCVPLDLYLRSHLATYIRYNVLASRPNFMGKILNMAKPTNVAPSPQGAYPHTPPTQFSADFQNSRKWP